MLRACIFDMDGVIVDTAKFHFRAWRRLANELGMDFTEEQNEQLKGVSRLDSLDMILEWGGLKLSDEEKVERANQKNEWYKEFVNKMTPDEILPGTVDFLDELSSAGIKIALGSASRNAVDILRQTHLNRYFNVIIDGNRVQKSKPDPEVFQLASHLLGVSPFQAVVFEDAVKGIEAAKSGGFYSVGIGEPKVLAKADFVVPSLAAINIELLINEFEKEPTII